MPKELARVMAQYNDIQARVKPLLNELVDHEREYILRSGELTTIRVDLAERLRSLKAKTGTDPQATNDAQVKNLLKMSGKYEALKSDRHASYVTTAKKVYTIRAEVVKLEKDVGAVIKAKSGIFSTSKSLPKLQALSKALKDFANNLQAAISAEL
jgi:hypothetical protein